MTPLHQRFIEELTRRNYAARTVATYVVAVAPMPDEYAI